MLSVSDIVHVVHLMGEAAQLPAPHHDRRAIEVFLDDELSRAVFGSPLLFRSRYGVRYVSPNQVYNRRYLPSGSHNDQVLCTLAQAGVPATRQILCGGDRLSVSDAIQDCLANFDISAPEIEWTAIAIATYLPPRQSWINKLGDRTNFDGLATELMHRNLAGGSCGGTHILGAVIALRAKGDLHAGLISESTVQQLDGYLRDAVGRIRESCVDEKAWPLSWYNRPLGGDMIPSMLATGHILELLSAGVPRQSADSARMLSAAKWLAVQLTERMAQTKEISPAEICPLAHAASAVVQFLPVHESATVVHSGPDNGK